MGIRSPYKKKPYLYFIRRDNGDIKIGYSNNLATRFSQLRQQHGDIEILGVIPGGVEKETELHNQFHLFRVPVEYSSHRGGHDFSEWFHSHSDLELYISANTAPYNNPAAKKYL